MIWFTAATASSEGPPIDVGQLTMPLAALCLIAALFCLKHALAPLGPLVRAVAAVAALVVAVGAALVLIIAAALQGALT